MNHMTRARTTFVVAVIASLAFVGSRYVHAQEIPGSPVVNKSGGGATYTPPTDAVTGTGANTRAAFWNDAQTLSSSANFVWDGQKLILNDPGTNDNLLKLTNSSGQYVILAKNTNSSFYDFEQLQNDLGRGLTAGVYGSTHGGTAWGITLSNVTSVFSDTPFAVGTSSAQPLILGTNFTARETIDSVGHVTISGATPTNTGTGTCTVNAIHGNDNIGSVDVVCPAGGTVGLNWGTSWNTAPLCVTDGGTQNDAGTGSWAITAGPAFSGAIHWRCAIAG